RDKLVTGVQTCALPIYVNLAGCRLLGAGCWEIHVLVAVTVQASVAYACRLSASGVCTAPGNDAAPKVASRAARDSPRCGSSGGAVLTVTPERPACSSASASERGEK